MNKRRSPFCKILQLSLIGLFLSLQIFALVSCGGEKESKVEQTTIEETDLGIVEEQLAIEDSINEASDTIIETSRSDLEQSIIDAGLVNIKEIDPTIVVDLKYSSTDNFVKIDLYGDLENCYLQKDIAIKLAKAQQILKERYPDYTLLVYDGVRPLRVQRILWDTIQVPSKIKHFYVAHPDSGSIHNYGAAVDLSIADSLLNPLDMGTPFDYFGKLAYPIREMELLEEGKLTHEQVNNRLILRNVMKDAGFTSITTEWWHFNGCSRAKAERLYQIVE